ncbi:MAG TPA: ABC transporter ATP-binding protein [Chitinophagaceae bacterium]|jgi:peptide/nickel transport system ATP-binding protein|nr:ABC transporter ATP-binding protein [Chitinophagaceae bacterium]
MTPLLAINNLSVDFISESGITKALKNISFSVNRGEIAAIVGESGSGKTVTSLSILQLLPSPPAKYSSGEILFSENGETSDDLLKKNYDDLRHIRGNKIAMIFQEPMSSLNPVFSCGHQVMEAIRTHKKNLGVSAKQARLQTIEWFSKVKLPDPEKIFNRYPHQLSGGQKQRVMIAMAMCCHPSLLICDEPTTALDVTVQKTILQLIRQLQQEQNIGVIFITHDLGVVAEVADKAIVMYKGEIVEQNTVKEIFNHPQHPYTKALLACRPVNHPRGERLPVVSDFLKEDKFQATNYEIRHKQQEPNSKFPIPKLTGEKILEVHNLSVWFPSKKNLFGKALEFIKAVDDVSFEVYKGETLGLVGESGCGKTTLGRALLRLIEPTSGKIIYAGRDLTAKKSDELKPLRKEIQIVFQDPFSSLNPRITIGSAIVEPMKVHQIFPDAKKRKEKVIELLEKVDLRAEHFSRYPHEFSGGQRQRIVIARALALNPSFIVCDESVSALDVSVQAQVLNLLNDLKKEFGFTIIFISHDLSVVRYISNRIMVMNKGKIEENGDADDIYFHPQKEYTKKLIASIPG